MQIGASEGRRVRDITASKFYGTRWEANISVGAGISGGINLSYARLPQREFTIGFGASLGTGASATFAAFNINTGVSAANVKHAQILIRNALGVNH
nr:hypothetical protein [uncultured Draconibacterium sp.]